MSKAKINDITEYIIYDYKNFKYKLIKPVNELPFHLQQFFEHNVNSSNLDVNIKTSDDLLMKVYPFIDSPNKDIIDQIIKRNKRVMELVQYSVENKKTEKLDFYDLGEKDKFIIGLAKNFIYDLNKMIYKFEINDLYCNKVFVNADINNLYIGSIDIIAKSKTDWYIVSLKTSKTNFTQKYMGELYLQKKLFENNTKFKISEMFIMNPRQERYLLEYKDISSREKYELSEI